MELKLKALKDFETMNFWQEPFYISKGEVYDAKLIKTDGGFEMIVLTLGGTPTAFEVRVIKEFFEIKEVNQHDTRRFN